MSSLSQSPGRARSVAMLVFLGVMGVALMLPTARPARRRRGRRRPAARGRGQARHARDRGGQGPQVDAHVGHRGLGADRRVPAAAVDLLHRDGDPPVHGIQGQRGRPPALVDKLEEAIKERKFQEAYDACRDDNSFLAKLVRTGVANLPNGRAEAKEAMNTLAEEIVVGMEARISYLATIGTLGPMIGLVGTIWGMIMSFQTIAPAAGGQPRPTRSPRGSPPPCSSPWKVSRCRSRRSSSSPCSATGSPRWRWRPPRSPTAPSPPSGPPPSSPRPSPPGAWPEPGIGNGR